MAKMMGMTGFGRATGEADWGQWAWEARSVNGRGLDIRLNMPSGLEELDQTVRKAVGAKLKRGNCQIALRIDTRGEQSDVAINHGALQSLIDSFEEATGRRPGTVEVATLMTVRGVAEPANQSIADLRAVPGFMETLTKGFEDALNQLFAARANEGASLQELMSGLLDQMETELAKAEAEAREQPALLKARLEQKLAELGADTSVDAERLSVEAALSAAKADVREELDRLAAHIATARDHLAKGGPMGRKLDFLSQEFNREANTLCSKSASLALTNSGLALKGLIDQFKEQAANVE